MYVSKKLLLIAEINTPGDDCPQRGCVTLTDSKRREHTAPRAATWGSKRGSQEAEEGRGKRGPEPLL